MTRKLFFTIATFCLLAFLFVLINQMPGPAEVQASVGQPDLWQGPQIDLPLILRAYPIVRSTPAFGFVLISEVLYDPFGSEPEGEWFELYNPGGSEIDLSVYKVGDAALQGDAEGMFLFPENSRLLPGGTVVVAVEAAMFQRMYNFLPDFEIVETLPEVPNLTPYKSWAKQGFELTNSGDEVLVLNASDQVVDILSWGSSSFAFYPPVAKVKEGSSLERYPPYEDTDSAQDWRESRNPQPGSVDLTPPTPAFTPTPVPTLTPVPTVFTGKLLLSEVMADPIGSDPQGEWIEIYNPGETTIWLQDFKLGDEPACSKQEGMLRFPEGAKIDGHSYIVVANSAASFITTYGYAPDFELTHTTVFVTDMEPYLTCGSGSLVLTNSGDDVLILDGLDQVVDALSYGASYNFFNPPIPLAQEGWSLERFPSEVDTNTRADWYSQPIPNPGYPPLRPVTPTPRLSD